MLSPQSDFKGKRQLLLIVHQWGLEDVAMCAQGHNTIKVFQVKVQEQSTQQLGHGNAYQTNYTYTDHILVTGRAWASTMLVRSMLSFCLYICTVYACVQYC